MKALTSRQQQVYDLIRDHINQTGMPPTRAEIASQLGFRSPNAAEEHLKALARKGVIEIVSGASRGIRLLMEEEASEGLPLIGRVAAGEPLLAQEHIEAHYQVDANLFKPSATAICSRCIKHRKCAMARWWLRVLMMKSR